MTFSVLDVVGRSGEGAKFAIAARIIEIDLQRPAVIPPSIYKIAREVADAHRVPVRLIVGRSRVRKVIVARHDFIRRLYPKYSSPLIGKWLKRNHTTILDAVYPERRRERRRRVRDDFDAVE